VTPAIAGLGIYIALRQWRTSHYRLKLDLFEKRWTIYIATKAILSSGSVNGDTSFVATFKRHTEQAEFLFKPRVVKFLNDVAVNHLELGAAFAALSKAEAAKIGVQEADERRRKIMDWWIQASSTGVTKIFKPYLDFRKIK
jgi:hypothetical protein